MESGAGQKLSGEENAREYRDWGASCVGLGGDLEEGGLRGFISGGLGEWSFQVLEAGRCEPAVGAPLLGREESDPGDSSPKISRDSLLPPAEQPSEAILVCQNGGCFEGAGLAKIKELGNKMLCSSCRRNYRKGLYCDYCRQIYGEGRDLDDGEVWVECDQCARWNHVKCTLEHSPSFSTDQPEHFCQRCIKKRPRKRSAQVAGLPTPPPVKRLLRPKEDGVCLFERPLPVLFGVLEPFLSGAGGRLGLRDFELKSDLARIQLLANREWSQSTQ
jgi:hypothetical protein